MRHRPETGRRRGGFTFIEVMFAAVLTGGLMAVLYQVFYATTQQSHRVSAKYEALQSSLTASEIIQRELDRLVTLPVARDARGYVQPRFGDHTRPVLMADDRRGLAFYVPGTAGPTRDGVSEDVATQTATPLSIDLIAGAKPGTFRLRRSTRPGGADDAADADPETRVYGGINLKTLLFRVLVPGADLIEQRSPDENYYVEAVIVGTDERGVEENALSVLKALNFPSERRYDPALPTVEYEPAGALEPPGTVVNPDPAEVEAAEELERIADEFRGGGLTPEELVDRARRTLEPLAGRTPTGALSSSRPQIPRIPPDATVLTPPGPGPTVIGSPTGDGPVAVLPPATPSGPAPAGPAGPAPGSGTISYWGEATVFDADGNPVWSSGFEGGSDSVTDPDELAAQRQAFEDSQRALEREMVGVADNQRNRGNGS